VLQCRIDYPDKNVTVCLLRPKKIPVLPVAVWRKSRDGGGGNNFVFIGIL